MDRTSRASCLGQPDALPPRVHFLLLQLVQLILLFRDEAAQGRPFCLVGFDLELFTESARDSSRQSAFPRAGTPRPMNSSLRLVLCSNNDEKEDGAGTWCHQTNPILLSNHSENSADLCFRQHSPRSNISEFASTSVSRRIRVIARPGLVQSPAPPPPGDALQNIVMMPPQSAMAEAAAPSRQRRAAP
jgi:hypothetical protein